MEYSFRFMFEKIVKILYIGVVVFLIASTIYTYKLGYSSGSNNVKLQYQNQLNQYKEEVKKKELKYAKENSELKDEIILVKRNYESKLTMLSNTYSKQLQESNSRAEYYKQQTNSTSKCRSLATYTARLDRSLTEGITLVKLLSEHIKLRNNQLRQVGKQIQQEREFIE